MRHRLRNESVAPEPVTEDMDVVERIHLVLSECGAPATGSQTSAMRGSPPGSPTSATASACGSTETPADRELATEHRPVAWDHGRHSAAARRFALGSQGPDRSLVARASRPSRTTPPPPCQRRRRCVHRGADRPGAPSNLVIHRSFSIPDCVQGRGGPLRGPRACGPGRDREPRPARGDGSRSCDPTPRDACGVVPR